MRKHIYICCLFFVLISTVGCSYLETSLTESGIADLIKAFAFNVKEGDGEAIAQLYVEPAIIMNGDCCQTTIKNNYCLNFDIRDAFSNIVKCEKSKPYIVLYADDLAIVEFSLTLYNSLGHIQDIDYTWIVNKVDDRWLIKKTNVW